MNETIQHINNAIAEYLKQYKDTIDLQAHGLAESIALRGDEDITIPAIVLPNGECFDVYGETDKHDVTLYHRLNDISFQENGAASVGSIQDYTSSADMGIIVFGKRGRISPYTLEKIVRRALAKQSNCTLVSSDFKSLQVFANEYLGVTYFMTPDYFLFKINYRITSTYNARCANFE